MSDKKYNLWILNHYSGNLEHGMEYRHFFLARHLRKMGHRVSIVCSTYSHLFSNPPKTNSIIETGVMDGVEFVWMKGPKYECNGIKRLLNMISYSGLVYSADLEKRIGRPDVVFGTSPHPFVLWNTLNLSKRFGVPSIVEIRDLWPLMLIELGSLTANHPLTKTFQWLESKSFREADRVISLWHSADSYMFEHGVDKDRYRYLPNGIELEDDVFKGEHELLAEVERYKMEGKFVIGYGGSHGHANPLDQVVDACKILQDENVDNILFFMVGDGPDKSQAQKKANDLNLNNLVWRDSVSKDVIMAFYDKLDVAFIGLRDLPLFRFGPTPNKLMDYLAAGKPIIYAINSSFDPVKERNLGISIQPDDGNKLSSAIKFMRDLPAEERIAMGKRSREFAEKEHSYSSLARKLNEIVIDLL